MKKGVINIVEVLVLLLIFLAAAAFFATFYLNSVTQQGEKVQQQAQQQTFLINPPAKIIGTIIIENYTNSDSQSANAKDAVPFACVEETSGSSNWWLANVYLLKGYQGGIFSSITTSDMVKAVIAASELQNTTAIPEAEENVTYVAFHPLNKVLAVCYVDGSPAAVFNLTVACDESVLNETVINATNWCITVMKNLKGTTWKVEFVNPFQYLPAGGTGVVVGPIIPYNVVQEGATFSFKITFAQSYKPNPIEPYQKALKGTLQYRDIVNWLKLNNNVTSAVGAFDAICEGCTFTVG